MNISCRVAFADVNKGSDVYGPLKPLVLGFAEHIRVQGQPMYIDLKPLYNDSILLISDETSSDNSRIALTWRVTKLFDTSPLWTSWFLIRLAWSEKRWSSPSLERIGASKFMSTSAGGSPFLGVK